MSELPVVRVYLNDNNTKVEQNPVPYNIHIQVDLTSIWKRLVEGNPSTAYIQLYTTIDIPILDNERIVVIHITVVNDFKVEEIINQRVDQYGYFKGKRDTSREIEAHSSIWKYQIMA